MKKYGHINQERKRSLVCFQPADFVCSPVCPHPCWFFRLSVCLLDGPLCHSATNGHCWASHFLNDTLLRSIQLPCSYTLASLPPFFFFLSPLSHAHHFLSCTTRWLSLPRVKEKQFLVNFSPQYFATQCASWWKTLASSDARTRWHALMHHISTAEWLTDGLRLEHLLPAGSSALILNRTIRSFIIHSSPTSLSFFFLPLHIISLPLLLIIFILLHVCVFFPRACVRVSSRGWRTAFSSIVSRTKDIWKPNWVWPSFDCSSPARLNPGSKRAHDHSHSPHISALQPLHTPGATCI